MLHVCSVDGHSGIAGGLFGASINSAALTTSIATLADSEKLYQSINNFGGNAQFMGGAGIKVVPGDLIRIHDNGVVDGTTQSKAIFVLKETRREIL